MNKAASMICVLGVALATLAPAHARDSKVLMPIAAAMAGDGAEKKLGNSVKFYFGAQ